MRDGSSARSEPLNAVCFSRANGPAETLLPPYLCCQASVTRRATPCGAISVVLQMQLCATDHGHGDITYGHGAISYGHGATTYGHGVITYGHGAITYGHGVITYGHGAITYGHLNGA